jgi:hypothetical protein
MLINIIENFKFMIKCILKDQMIKSVFIFETLSALIDCMKGFHCDNNIHEYNVFWWDSPHHVTLS